MKLEIEEDQAEKLVIEMLKGDLRRMIHLNGVWDDRGEVNAIAGVLRYYMRAEDCEAFFAEIGYNREEGFIDVVDVVDNPDGSADITVSITDEKLKQKLVEEGLEYILLKNAFDLTSDDVVRLVERGTKEDIIVDNMKIMKNRQWGYGT